MDRMLSAAFALRMVMALPGPAAPQSGGKLRIDDRRFGFDVMPTWARTK
jgi:hypothetical protein